MHEGSIPLPGGNQGQEMEQTDGLDIEKLAELAQIDELKVSIDFIRALEAASLDDDNM